MFPMSDPEVWQQELKDFVPDRVFDVHVHLWRAEDMPAEVALEPSDIGIDAFPSFTMEQFRTTMDRLLPGRTVKALAFGLPHKNIPREGLNRYVSETQKRERTIFGLAVIAPHDPMQDVRQWIENYGLLGYKPYWNLVTLSELPNLLVGHQLPADDPNAGAFYWRFDHGNGGSAGVVSGYTEDAIFGTLGLVAASQANPTLEVDDAIIAGRQALLGGISSEGKVWERLSQKGSVYYAYAGEMLTVLGELIIPGDLNLDGGVDFADFAVFADNWHDSGCTACSWCNCADLDHNGEVNFSDLEITVDNWLGGMGH